MIAPSIPGAPPTETPIKFHNSLCSQLDNPQQVIFFHIWIGNYKNIECENSLYLFHFDHIVRQFCLKVSQTIIFKLVVNSTLILTTILLIYDTYVESDYIHSMKYYDGYIILDHIRWFALTIFICNITTLVCYSVKVIAKGLIMDEGTFCKDIWGAFDLIYLFCYFLNYGSNQPILEIAQYMSIWLIRNLSIFQTHNHPKHV